MNGIARMLKQPVTVVTVNDDGARDDMGDPIETTSETEWKAYLWQSTTREADGNQEVAIGEWRAALPAAAADVVNSAARLIADGITYDVLGIPWAARNARTNIVEHVELKLVVSE